MLVTALNPHIGYENSAKIALKAHRDRTTLREAALALGLVSRRGLRPLDRRGGDDAAGLERIREHVGESLMLVTALNPHIGYENAAKIAQKAHRDATSLREAALALGLVSAEDFDRWIDAAAMTRPDV